MIWLSWAELPTSAATEDAPDLHFELLQNVTPSKSELILEFYAVDKGEGTEATYTAAAQNHVSLDANGDIPASEWRIMLHLAKKFYGVQGEGTIRFALFEPRQGKDMPTKRLSNWTSLYVQL